MKLPATEVALLEAASATDPRTVEQLAEETGEKPEAVTRAAFELADEGLVAVEERTEESYALTDEGETYLESGLPELRLYRAAVEAGAADDPVSMGRVIGASGLEGPEVDIALSNFARKGLGRIDSGELSAEGDADPDADAETAALAAVAAADDPDPEVADRLAERGLLDRSEVTERAVTLTDDGVTALMEGVETAETVGQLTPEMLTSGEWEDVEFAEYNVEADAEPVTGGRSHILRQTAEAVKDTLVGMGFEEMDGPHADADFWINDALFMPQDHPARTHWDRFTLDVDPMDDLPDDLVGRVEDAHRNGVGPDGEGYHSPWSREFAEEVALRGHTTSLSMRYLSGYQVGELEPPQRFFSVEKVYRNDTLDPTHLLEFFQIEGWVMADDLSVRDLMGTFEEFYSQFGITDIEFKPHYNPYTEPSFELFGTHPETGEIVEIGNSGIFRDEVLEPLGVECDVMAWGLALERLLMLMYGFEDIRDVHGTLCDLDLLRNVEVVH
ncbi:phenylalanine--tRNA ligase subunit alpha [Halosegnis marinus]|uniref:Phenylalanine--tRNA ligase alpha subunit n=1 Tax=Halosegnis marinus TaxID=3034023 RepID=A0ABD5ZNJ6_9EURY|nr:phenylalanine--tRNA ligase subunit alpha [Halosegnis sp. DT85]